VALRQRLSPSVLFSECARVVAGTGAVNQAVSSHDVAANHDVTEPTHISRTATAAAKFYELKRWPRGAITGGTRCGCASGGDSRLVR
jgi:hypothetical protein